MLRLEVSAFQLLSHVVKNAIVKMIVGERQERVSRFSNSHSSHGPGGGAGHSRRQNFLPYMDAVAVERGLNNHTLVKVAALAFLESWYQKILLD